MLKSDDSSSDNGYYEVERILNDSILQSKGVRYYLIKWRNYDASFNTWEPEENLNCPEILKSYLNKKIGKKKSTSSKHKKRRIDNEESNLYIETKEDKIKKFQEMLDRLNNFQITIENTIDDEGCPKDFEFISENIYGKDIVKFNSVVSGGCECEGQCKNDGSCACFDNNLGQVPYDRNGKIIQTEKTMVYECNSECKCGSDCILRSVQKGMKIPLKLVRLEGKGWGVFTTEKIEKGTFVAQYIGEVISSKEVNRRQKVYSEEEKRFIFDLDFNPTAQSSYSIDSSRYGNIARFFNHSCDPNLTLVPLLIDNLNPFMHLNAFFACRDILIGEELSFDYQGIRGNLAPIQENALTEASKGEIKCLCKAANCRGYVF